MNLAEYGTVGNLIGLVGKRSVYLEGVFASCTDRSTKCISEGCTGR